MHERRYISHPLVLILELFTKSPTIESLKALMALRSNQAKFIEKDKKMDDKQFVQTLIDVRRRQSLDWSSNQSLGPEITRTLIKLWCENKLDKSAIEIIYPAIEEDLTNERYYLVENSRMGWKDWQKGTGWRCDTDYMRLQDLMMQCRELHGQFRETVIEKASSKVRIALKQLVIGSIQEDNDGKRYTNTSKSSRPELVNHVEGLTEVLVEMSHQDKERASNKKGLSESSQNQLFAAFARLIQYPIPGMEDGINQLPGPSYKLVLSHSLAAAFLVRFQETEKRTQLLQQLLNEFEGHISGSAYPLPLLVVGHIFDKDIPSWDKGNVLADRLKGYKGVFAEEAYRKVLNKPFLKHF